MSDILEKARQFVDACDGGKGWEVCKVYCHPDATFSVQAAALAEIHTVEAYTEWAKNLLTPIPDAHTEVRFCAEDKEHGSVAVYSVFLGTQTGPGGPGDPTGRAVESDFVYVMAFEDGKIRHITKIWNDADCLQQLGWA